MKAITGAVFGLIAGFALGIAGTFWYLHDNNMTGSAADSSVSDQSTKASVPEAFPDTERADGSEPAQPAEAPDLPVPPTSEIEVAAVGESPTQPGTDDPGAFTPPDEPEIVFASDGQQTGEDIPASRPIQSIILEIVGELDTTRTGLGYDAGAVHTEDLHYGEDIIKATRDDDTMCVAAVSEVMIRAVERWSERYSDKTPFSKFTASSWMSGRRTALRPWLYRFKGTKIIPEYNSTASVGARDAFTLFGLGVPVAFKDMTPGDVIYFNRPSSGHAAIFLGYLGPDFEELEVYSEAVTGFRYFSAQQKTNPGLGMRYAYFGDGCPSQAVSIEQGKLRDCKIIRRESDPAYLSGARLNSPDDWQTEDSALFIDKFYAGETIEQIAAERYAKDRALVPLAMMMRLYAKYSEPEEGEPAVSFDGMSTD